MPGNESTPVSAVLRPLNPLINSIPLLGLVLAGGGSERMGQDKGRLCYHGTPQVLWLRRLLADFCDSVYVSTNDKQRSSELYADLPTVVDQAPDRGPAMGLISAWEAVPGSAWLVVAVDMPFLDRGTLMALVDGRNPAALATAFQHPDGTLDPLCAIWEAAAQPALTERIQAGDTSLRRCLEAGQIQVLQPPSSQALISVNSPAEYQDARRRLEDSAT